MFKRNWFMSFSERGIKHQVRGGILGLVVGDALGVPVEFRSREEILQQPVTGMTGFGTHHQPAGTWSDDSSLTLCLAEVLCDGFDLDNIGRSFVDWLDHYKWTAHGRVFDVGIATSAAIDRLRQGIQPDLAGGTDEYSNGNGSLMRILPLLYYVRDMAENERFEVIQAVSSITHAHIRSVLACFYYIEFARMVCDGQSEKDAYVSANAILRRVMDTRQVPENEASHFDRILSGRIFELPEKNIRGSGYVIHSLEASLWCVLTSGSYPEAVLKAVNLGEDTDTTGAITGGLAGIVFGDASIPVDWISMIARIGEIEELIERLGNTVGGAR